MVTNRWLAKIIQQTMIVLPASLAVVALLICCAESPSSQLSAANTAVDAVVADGAEQFTPDELKPITDKLEEALAEIKAQDALFFKNYSRAQYKLMQVVVDTTLLQGVLATRKAELKASAVAALSEAQAAIATGRVLCDEARQDREASTDVAVKILALAGLERALQQIPPLIDAEEFNAAIEQAHSVADNAMIVSNELRQGRKKLAFVQDPVNF